MRKLSTQGGKGNRNKRNARNARKRGKKFPKTGKNQPKKISSCGQREKAPKKKISGKKQPQKKISSCGQRKKAQKKIPEQKRDPCFPKNPNQSSSFNQSINLAPRHPVLRKPLRLSRRFGVPPRLLLWLPPFKKRAYTI